MPAGPVASFRACTNASPASSSRARGGKTHESGGSLYCYERSNDPRVSGKSGGTFDFEGWGGSVENGAEVFSGTLRLVNDGGAWDGYYTGIYTSETGDLWSIWYTGTGAYAGLSYCVWSGGPFTFESDAHRASGAIDAGGRI